jgi:hypothetical protein
MYLKGSNKMVYMRHRWFLIKGHRHRKVVMNKYFDYQDEPQLEEPARTRYGVKVFGLVKDMEVEFGKKEESQRGDWQDKEEKAEPRQRRDTAYPTRSFQEEVNFLQVSVVLENIRYTPCHRLHAPGEECLRKHDWCPARH